jgi:hypothetical protein
VTRSLYLLAFVGALATAYRRIFHPWQERWGARDEELVASLPGDELISDPAGQVTRAIEIAAPPEALWPWQRGRRKRLDGARGERARGG